MDRRKFNGGNSTKSKGIDKRKNSYRKALENAATVEDVELVIKEVLGQAKAGDLTACKLFLEYYLGKPKETIELTDDREEYNLKALTDAELAVLSKLHQNNDDTAN